MENTPQRADNILDYPEDDLPLVHTDATTDPFQKIRVDQEHTPVTVSKFAVIAVTVVVVAALTGLLVALLVRPKNTNTTAALKNINVCADTNVAARERAATVYTDQRYLQDGVAESSDGNVLAPWCVFTTAYDSSLYWGLVYVGDSNPIYTAMLAESGDRDDASRAVITYQNIPPIKFAKGGWIGFITPSDEDDWTASRAAQTAQELSALAQRASSSS